MAGPDAAKARRRYDKFAATYDRQLAPLRLAQEHIRQDTIARLNLRHGATVIDAGCGTGASFAALVTAVGLHGRVVGVDQSAGMLVQARRRVDTAGWDNIELLHAPVQHAQLPSGADAALFFFTHDLLRTPTALDNVVSALHPGGRIATAGVRLPAMWVLPLVLPPLLLMRRYVTTIEGIRRPWDLLDERLQETEIRLHLLGAVYQVIGRTSSEQ